jgi:branched-chain amino acid transport system substrate-binding protein
MNVVLRAAAAVTLAAGLLSSARAAEPEPYELNAILSLSGTAAESGGEEAESLRTLAAVVNKAGGIRGRPLKFVIADDGSSPQVAVQLVNAVIAKKAPVFLGSSVTGTCSAMAPLVSATAPVMYCFAPGLNPPAGSYAFTASVNAYNLVKMVLNYARARGWNRIALLMTTDATGQELDRQFANVLAEPENRGISAVAHEHFTAADISVTAQVARIKALDPQMLVIWSIGTPFGTALRGVHDVGLQVPIMASAGDMTYAQMTQYAPFLTNETYFPATAAAIPAGMAPAGPVREAQERFFSALHAAGIHPSFPHNLAWDPGMLIVGALRKIGPSATATQIRDYIENTHGLVGIDGVYDFSDGSQRGVSLNAARLYKWDAAKKDFVQVARGNGKP